ncbi:MAG: hypothetical protein MEQ07_11380 [Aquimonas sp.]|nr:hypothetical protein [Aquimonas sp.]
MLVTDPNFAFAVTRTVRDFSGQRGRNIEPFLLVGLIHDRYAAVGASRARHYTPSLSRRDGRRYQAPAYGDADTFPDWMEERVLALLKSHYRADTERVTFLGHSYGSLLGLHALFTRPGLLASYILGSPSLWFDVHVIFRTEETYATVNADL